jgi:hypothetical protein
MPPLDRKYGGSAKIMSTLLVGTRVRRLRESPRWMEKLPESFL